MTTIVHFLNIIAPVIGWACIVSTTIIFCWVARQMLKKEKKQPRKYNFYEGQLTDIE